MKQIYMAFLILACFTAPAFSVSEKELFDKGVSLLKKEAFPEAVTAFSQLIKIAPENPDAYKNRGVAYMKKGDYDQAIMDFEKTRELKPDLKGLYSNLGVAYYYKGDYDRAIKNYNMEIALTPDNYYAFFNRAICRAELNELGKSLEDVNQSITLSPDFYLALCLKGDLLTKMGKIPQAKEAYERALEIDPEHKYAKDQLAELSQSHPAVQTSQTDSKSDNKGKDALGQKRERAVVKKKIVLPEKPTRPKKSSAPEKTVPVKLAGVKQAPPVKPALPAKTASPVKKGGPDYLFELQAGAYTGKKNADDMVLNLSGCGYKVRMIEMTRPNGKHWFLVRTGGFQSREAADAGKQEAVLKCGMDIIVRPYGEF